MGIFKSGGGIAALTNPFSAQVDVLSGGMLRRQGRKVGSIVDEAIMGKKDPGYGPGRISLDPEVEAARNRNLAYQKTAMERLAGATAGSPEAEAEAQASREIASEKATTEDASKRLQQLIAQRGIGGTSMGLTSQVAQEKSAQDRIAEIKASIPERIRALKLQNAQLLLGASNQSLATPGIQGEAFAGQEASRKGGLLPLAGMAAGAYFGGAQGAQVGMGAGQYTQGAFG